MVKNLQLLDGRQSIKILISVKVLFKQSQDPLIRGILFGAKEIMPHYNIMTAETMTQLNWINFNEFCIMSISMAKRSPVKM